MNAPTSTGALAGIPKDMPTYGLRSLRPEWALADAYAEASGETALLGARI